MNTTAYLSHYQVHRKGESRPCIVVQGDAESIRRDLAHVLRALLRGGVRVHRSRGEKHLRRYTLTGADYGLIWAVMGR